MKLTLKKIAERIEASNAKFEKMSKTKKRIEIAKDCLLRIKIKQFDLSTRGYTINGIFQYGKYNQSVKDVVNSKKMPECSVCAKGLMFLSYVGRVNDCILDEVEDSTYYESKTMTKLNEIFSMVQLDLIETAFECSVIHDEYYYNNRYRKLFDQSIIYAKQFNSREGRLISICKNIIKNNGKFDPFDIVPVDHEIELV